MSGLGNRTINQALTDARAIHFLNDSDNSTTGIYNDATLLPVAAFVLGEIQDEFAKYSIPVKEKIDPTSFQYTAQALSIPIPGAITDFRHPIELWEKPVDSQFWIPMRRVTSLPAPPPTAQQFLRLWEYSEDTIKVNKASANRDILVRYRRQTAYPAAGTETPGTEDFYWALVAGVAYYASQGTERDNQADRFNGIYRKRTLDAIRIASRDMQAIEVRQESANERGQRRSWIVMQ